MKGIRVHSLRYGFATNSSSTHSLVFMPGTSDSGVNPGWYQWDDFTLASAEAKTDYLLTALYQSYLAHHVDEDDGTFDETTEEAATIARLLDITPAYIAEFINGHDKWGPSIDHQSVLGFPSNLDENYLTSFIDVVLHDDVVILGGNDNSDGHPDYPGEDVDLNWMEGRIRYDAMNELYTIFNSWNGTKRRISFAGTKSHELGPDMIKLQAPELVDIKITNKCHTPKACAPYCYQASHGKGQHGSWDDIKRYLDVLAAHDVFEVAIGGGEPTMHPNFAEIVTYAAQVNIKPNFTTRSFAWLQQPAAVSAVKKHVGAFAVSVNTKQDVTDAIAALKGTDFKVSGWNKKVMFQHVLGSVSIEDFEELVDEIASHGAGLTLLGYKITGRGKNIMPHGYYAWFNIVRKAEIEVGIDTKLAQEFESLLIAADVPRYLFSVNEGSHSMYIDTVKQTMGPSSFCPDEDMKNFTVNDDTYSLETHSETFRNVWMSF